MAVTKEDSASVFMEILKSSSTKKEVCSFQALIDGMDEKLQSVVVSALGNQEFTTASIYRTLQAMGFKIGRESISHHRNLDCRCREEK